MTVRRLVLILAVWLFGVACGLGYVEVSGGWYEYRVVFDYDTTKFLVNNNGWETVGPLQELVELRRPRFRLNGSDAPVPRSPTPRPTTGPVIPPGRTVTPTP